MSDCGFCIDNDVDGGLQFHEETWRKCRKPFKCEECNRPVGIGMVYEYAAGKFDGDFFTVKTCADCANIRNAFVCGGFQYGELWEEIENGLFVKFNEACLAEVETASAKQYLVDRWRNWKGIA